MFISKGYSKRKSSFLTSQDEQEQFIRKVSTDFIHDMNLFKGYKKVIFCLDSKSWRKTFYPLYKGNRIKQDDINWEQFYLLIDEFAKILEEYNIIISRVDEAEGDDLIYLWTRYFHSKGESTIILSGDADITQLVSLNDDIFNIVYNNNSTRKKFTVPKGFSKFINTSSFEQDSFDIFNMNTNCLSGDDDISTLLKKLLNTIPLEEIDPNTIILEKMLCGDKSDNIPSIYSWERNGVKTRVTDKYYKEIQSSLIEMYDEINIEDIMANSHLQKLIRDKIQQIGKVDVDVKKFNEGLNRNIKLVYLKDTIIPSYISDRFTQCIDEDSLNKRTYLLDRIELLKTTRFEKKMDDGVFLSPLFH